MGYIMYIRYALVRDGYLIHTETLEVSDTATEGALHNKGVAGIFQRGCYFCITYQLQLLGAEEDGIIVLGFHHSLATFGTKFTER